MIRFENIFKMSWRDIFAIGLEDVLNASCKLLQDVFETSRRRLEDVSSSCIHLDENVMKTSYEEEEGIK